MHTEFVSLESTWLCLDTETSQPVVPCLILGRADGHVVASGAYIHGRNARVHAQAAEHGG